MPSINELMASPSTLAVGTASHAIATATTSTPGSVRGAIAVFGFLITSSAVPAATVVATLSDGTTTMSVDLPATIFPAGFVFMFPSGHPFVAAAQQPVVLTVPDLGAGIVSHLTIAYTTVSPK